MGVYGGGAPHINTPPPMRLQIVSDIHLEFGRIFHPYVAGDAIALLGDIGHPHTDEYQALVLECSKQYRHVFVVAGNHEYYRRHKTHEYTRELLRALCAPLDNVHLLDNGFAIVDGVRFVGTTLWTALDHWTGTEAMQRMTDYRQIMKMGESKKVTVSWRDTNAWHREAVQYIEGQVEEARRAGQRVVVLTHHAPTFDERVQRGSRHGPDNPAYATELRHIIQAPIVLWAYGHTHWCADFHLNGVRLVSNAFGYPGEDTGGYQEGKCVEL